MWIYGYCDWSYISVLYVDMRKTEKSLEDELYYCGLAALVFIIAGSIFLYVASAKEIKLPPCIFNVVTGLYCPGCGGTRAVRALIHGHLLRAVWYHPFVVYGVAVYVIFMVSHTIRKFINHNVKGMKYRNVYIYIWLAILILNFIIRNILLIKFGITLD